MSSNVTYKYIKQNPDIHTYIKNADAAVAVQGYTEHSFAHVEKVADTVKMILEGLDCDERKVELGMIAAYMHDIGNVINRVDHAQSGAVMAFRLLDNLNMPAEEICDIISAIGNHDEGTAQPLNAITAALIIADKTDVRRSRVRNINDLAQDIHDRVNFAVERSELNFNEDKTELILELNIDNRISSVMEYFEIFMNRMILCKKSAEFLGVRFRIRANGSDLV
ncbi:MAG: HD domain-containing protein [Oscillospiraceae bacterium]|nr:HD domain-containing protein [Oscillospiraceae bacterium]MDY6207247.1 HD domain-containing protein [Oscillospiraceae bacterium]